MCEISPFLHPVHTYPREKTQGGAYVLYPKFDVKILLCTPHAVRDLEYDNAEAQLEHSAATLLKKITLHCTNNGDIYSIRNIHIYTPNFQKFRKIIKFALGIMKTLTMISTNIMQFDIIQHLTLHKV